MTAELNTSVGMSSMSDQRTISERLAACGMEHSRDAKTAGDGRHSIFRDGEFIARANAQEAISLLCDAAQ